MSKLINNTLEQVLIGQGRIWFCRSKKGGMTPRSLFAVLFLEMEESLLKCFSGQPLLGQHTLAKTRLEIPESILAKLIVWKA